MSTYTDRLNRPYPKRFIEKSFAEMSDSEFAYQKRKALYGIDSFKKEPAFSRTEFLQDTDLWVDNITPKRKKTDEENFHLNYFKSKEKLMQQIKLQLQQERFQRKEDEDKLPEWQKNLSWGKLLQSKLVNKSNHK